MQRGTYGRGVEAGVVVVRVRVRVARVELPVAGAPAGRVPPIVGGSALVGMVPSVVPGMMVVPGAVVVDIPGEPTVVPGIMGVPGVVVGTPLVVGIPGEPTAVPGCVGTTWAWAAVLKARPSRAAPITCESFITKCVEK